MRRLAGCTFVLLAAPCLWSQTLKVRPGEPSQPPATAVQPKPALSVPLTLSEGTPLKVVLEKEVRIQKVGQPIYGKTREPIYAFDTLLVPAGTEVIGKISGIGAVSGKTRTLAAMDADFSPNRAVHVEFDDLVMKDGQRIPIHTMVEPGSNAVLQFVPANGSTSQGKGGHKAEGKGKLSQAKQQMKQQIAAMRQQVAAPDKLHRLKRFAVAQLPYHPQYMDVGTSFNAEMLQPISFGDEHLKAEKLTEIGTEPPSGSVVRAWLVTPLSSATNKKGDPVDAVISEPLVVSGQLFLPEGSHLKGTVLQVRKAGRFGHNGQLRITFHEVVPPNGIEEKVEATLKGLDVAKGENLKLDSEGGAEVTAPKSRYLKTGIAVALAASAANPDSDAGANGFDSGDLGRSAANGASGFKLLGTLVTVIARSRTTAAGFGAYGAAMSIYSHFLARGRDVVYPKDMTMVLALGTREKQATQPAASALSAASKQPEN